jgi:hypothetical protein
MDLFAVDRLPGWLDLVPDQKQRQYLEAVLSSHFTASNAASKTTVTILAVRPGKERKQVLVPAAAREHDRFPTLRKLQDHIAHHPKSPGAVDGAKGLRLQWTGPKGRGNWALISFQDNMLYDYVVRHAAPDTLVTIEIFIVEKV